VCGGVGGGGGRTGRVSSRTVRVRGTTLPWGPRNRWCGGPRGVPPVVAVLRGAGIGADGEGGRGEKGTGGGRRSRTRTEAARAPATHPADVVEHSVGGCDAQEGGEGDGRLHCSRELCSREREICAKSDLQTIHSEAPPPLSALPHVRPGMSSTASILQQKVRCAYASAAALLRAERCLRTHCTSANVNVPRDPPTRDPRRPRPSPRLTIPAPARAPLCPTCS
jgi:hypothetical protein